MSQLERIGFLASAQEEAVIVLPWKEEYNELVDSDQLVGVNDVVDSDHLPDVKNMIANPATPFLLLVAQKNSLGDRLLCLLADTAPYRKYIATDNYLFAITYHHD